MHLHVYHRCPPEGQQTIGRGEKMPRVALNQIAPDFSLPSFAGNTVSLSDFRGRKNVLLVFNRGFM